MPETKHFVDEAGEYLGAADFALAGGIEVPVPPGEASQRWDFEARDWGGVPADVLADRVRAERDARIGAVAWRFERHASEVRLGLEPTDDIMTLDAYAQALRDVPAQPGFPETISWPVEPE